MLSPRYTKLANRAKKEKTRCYMYPLIIKESKNSLQQHRTSGAESSVLQMSKKLKRLSESFFLDKHSRGLLEQCDGRAEVAPVVDLRD